MRVVFVHGALVFDGAWWWQRMVEPLEALGFGTRAVELPSCVEPPVASSEGLGDMHADADAVREALLEEGGELVVVGHSYGGLVMTDAAAGVENVRHLIYVSSVMPDADETMASFGGEPGPWMDPRPEEGTMGIRPTLVPDAFLQDCDGAAVEGALARLTRQPLAVFGQAPRGVAWREKPTTYVVCSEDRATPPELQRRYARRAGTVLELASGHHPMLSRPAELAEVIAGAAGRRQAWSRAVRGRGAPRGPGRARGSG